MYFLLYDFVQLTATTVYEATFSHKSWTAPVLLGAVSGCRKPSHSGKRLTKCKSEYFYTWGVMAEINHRWTLWTSPLRRVPRGVNLSRSEAELSCEWNQNSLAKYFWRDFEGLMMEIKKWNMHFKCLFPVFVTFPLTSAWNVYIYRDVMVRYGSVCSFPPIMPLWPSSGILMENDMLVGSSV